MFEVHAFAGPIIDGKSWCWEVVFKVGSSREVILKSVKTYSTKLFARIAGEKAITEYVKNTLNKIGWVD